MATQSAGHEHPQQQSEELVAHGATGAVVGTTNTQTLTNKTLTAPVVNTSLTGTAVGTGASQVAAGDHTHAAAAKIKTGSYTGDGATSLAITGVGFTPKYVRIWNRVTTGNQAITIIETSTDIVDDNASGMAIEDISAQVASVTDRIISLDADGFTVDDAGVDAHPNKNGTVYNYLALG